MLFYFFIRSNSFILFFFIPLTFMVNATVRRFDFSHKHEQWQIYNFTLKLQCAVHYSWLINTFVPGHSQSNYFHKE